MSAAGSVENSIAIDPFRSRTVCLTHDHTIDLRGEYTSSNPLGFSAAKVNDVPTNGELIIVIYGVLIY